MSKPVIVLELGKEVLTAVELRNRATGPELIRYTLRNVPQTEYNPGWLKAVWEQEHFSHNKIICVLPTSIVKFKSVIVPNLPDDQLEAAVQMELDNGTGRGEIYKVINYQKQDQILVKVVVLKNDQLKEHLNFLHEAGLEVLWSGLGSGGIQNFINFNSGYFDDPGEGATYLDLIEEQTEFGVINGAEIVYRRDFPSGAPDVGSEESEEFMTDFLEEVRLSLASFKTVAEIPIPSKVWLFGKVEVISQMMVNLKEELRLNLYIPEKSKLTGVLTSQHTPELAPLIGLALDEIGLSRLEPLRIFSMEQATAIAKQQKMMFFAGLGLMGIILAAGLFLGMQAGLEKQAKINQWLAEQAGLISTLRRTEQITNQNLEQIRTMEAWLAIRGRELEFLLTLLENLPEGTKISDITLEDGVVKDLLGTTPQVSLLLNRIRQVPKLQNLTLKGTITSSTEGELFHLEGPITVKEPAKK